MQRIVDTGRLRRSVIRERMKHASSAGGYPSLTPDPLAGILPQGALNILNEQLTRLTSHRTSALSVGFIGGLLVALWSANAGAKAISLNVAYGETEKRSFIHLNLVALAFTLGTIFALMLALGGGRSDCAFAAWIERCARDAH